MMKGRRIRIVLIISALVLLCLSLVVPLLLTPEGSGIGLSGKIFASLISFLLLVNLVYLLVKKAGSLRYQYITRVNTNLMVVFGTVLLLLLSLELVLRTGWLDSVNDWRAKQTAKEYEEVNRRINQANEAYAADNPHGFTDKPRSWVRSLETRKRIAVLGDSFIWGDGLPYDSVWSHKLERLITEYDNTIEVMSWGRNGWATQQEFDFLIHEGVRYGIDLLLVGYVSNDPDMRTKDPNHRDIPQKYLKWQNGYPFPQIRIVFPNMIDFAVPSLNRVLMKYVFREHGYENWENSLYSPENLKEYLNVLFNLAIFCREQGIDLLFVLTPNNPDQERFPRQYNSVIPLFERAGIPYFDLFPAMSRGFGGEDFRSLRANPANGHPGGKVTSLFAREVFAYLLEDGYLD